VDRFTCSVGVAVPAKTYALVESMRRSGTDDVVFQTNPSVI